MRRLSLCGDGVVRVADPSFVEACQLHNLTRYYTYDIELYGHPDVMKHRTWLACPTFIGTPKHIVPLIISERLYPQCGQTKQVVKNYVKSLMQKLVHQ